MIEDLRAVMPGDDLDRIRRLHKQLQQASHAPGQQLYQQGGLSTSSDGERPGGQRDEGEEDVVEGEYRRV